MTQTLKISIGDLLRRRAPRVAAMLPPIAVHALEKRLCVDRLNDYITHHAELPTSEFLHRFLGTIRVDYSIEGLDRLPAELDGKVSYVRVFLWQDGVVLAAAMIDRFGDVGVVVNDLLSEIRPLDAIWLPVNLHGRQRGDYALRYEEALRGDKPIVTFPAGLCSRRIDGRVRDTEWHTSFVRRAMLHDRDIVPVYVAGQLSDAFYRLADIRRRLGIGFNLEMMRLPSEMFAQSGQTIRVRVGEAMPSEQIRRSESLSEVCSEIRRRVYQMAM